MRASTGTQTATGSADTLATITLAGQHQACISLDEMVNGDTLDIKVQVQNIASGGYVTVQHDILTDVQSPDCWVSEPVSSAHGFKVIIDEDGGSLNDYDWQITTEIEEVDAVYLDTNNGTSGTVAFLNGTPSNPVDTIANALTLLTNTGLNKIVVLPNSSVTLAASFEQKIMEGTHYDLALGNQSLTGSSFKGATVSGLSTSTVVGNSDRPRFIECEMAAVTSDGYHLERCQINGTQTCDAGSYIFEDCFSYSGAEVIDCNNTGSIVIIQVHRYSGSLTVSNSTSTVTGEVGLTVGGDITLGGNGGTWDFRGQCETFTDNSTGTTVDTSGLITSSVDAKYWVDAYYIKNEDNANDRYVCTWYKDGTIVDEASVTSPTLTVLIASNGSTWISAATMEHIDVADGEDHFKYEADDSERITAGEPVIAVFSATIDGAARTFSRIFGRDV